MKNTEINLKDGASAWLPRNFLHPSLIHNPSSSLEVLAKQEMQAAPAPTQSTSKFHEHNKTKKNLSKWKESRTLTLKADHQSLRKSVSTSFSKDAVNLTADWEQKEGNNYFLKTKIRRWGKENKWKPQPDRVDSICFHTASATWVLALIPREILCLKQPSFCGTDF